MKEEEEKEVEEEAEEEAVEEWEKRIDEGGETKLSKGKSGQEREKKLSMRNK